MSARDVVVTGMGMVSSHGHEVEAAFEQLLSGVSGIRLISEDTHFDASGCPCSIGGTVLGFDEREVVRDRPTLRHLRVMDPVHRWALCASVDAMRQAGLDPTTRRSTEGPFLDAVDGTKLGVCVGTGLSGRDIVQSFGATMFNRHADRAREWLELGYDAFLKAFSEILTKDADPTKFFQQCPSVCGAYIAMRYGAAGPNLTLVSLCAAGSQAIGEAGAVIRRGDADVMIAVGADSMLNLPDLTAFCMLQAVTGKGHEGAAASRPFSLTRDGCVVGEGAAALVLEAREHAELRGATILARLSGYGTSSDAYKISAPPPNGDGAVLAMRNALRAAGLAPQDIGHVNAHGTSTPLNDRIETIALKRVFGRHAFDIPVVSTKSMTGHLIAAAGSLEAIVTIQALRRQIVPPTINLDVPDPDCDLDYVTEGYRPVRGLRHALSNSFAIGGVNSTLIFSAEGGRDG
jgi:3-oxoacyl-[acyl-carrier-protein] synthase II